MSSGLQAFGGVVEAVFLDVGGVFHLPDPAIVVEALRRAGVDGPLEPEVLDRAHYAGVAALVDWPEVEAGIWTAYEEAYAREAGAAPECIPDTMARVTPVSCSARRPSSEPGTRRLHTPF